MYKQIHIACGDADPREWNHTAYKAHYATLKSHSRLMAPMMAEIHLQCLEWRVRPRTRYTGPLAAARTAHPLLIIASRYDPVSPMADARAVQALYGGAGLLVQDSAGHCSPSAPSLCTAQHVRAYLEDGTLPEEGTVCEPDELPFGVARTDSPSLSIAELRGLL